MTVWPVQHAKARFSELLDACQREGPQVVSRRGTEAAVLVPIEQWRRLQAAARPSLKELLLAAEARTEALVPPRGQARRPHQRGFGAPQAKAPWRRARLVAERR